MYVLHVKHIVLSDSNPPQDVDSRISVDANMES